MTGRRRAAIKTGMAPYTDAELAALLRDGESHLVERKRNAGDGAAIRRNVCAFANDLPGTGRPGVVFIGVEDDGGCAHAPIDDELLSKLSNMRSEANIAPLPSLSVEKRNVDGCEVAIVQVAPSAYPPVRYDGRVWVRVGPSVRQASADDEQSLTEKRRAADLPFDMRPAPMATLDDLDLDYARNQYLPQVVAPDVLARNRRPLEQQLRALRLVVASSPAWGALLGLRTIPQGWIPGAYVQFRRVDGRDIADPTRDQKRLTGKLEDVLGRLSDLLALNVSVRTEVAAVPREERRPDYPVEALRQLAWNAAMHRSYDSAANAPVRVSWYDDRVEIENPGGLLDPVTKANFGDGSTAYRNPLVAEIMSGLGFAQRFGQGVPLARRALAENGNPPPEFAFAPERVAVTVRAAP